MADAHAESCQVSPRGALDAAVGEAQGEQDGIADECDFVYVEASWDAEFGEATQCGGR
jgi:hypothetical protein